MNNKSPAPFVSSEIRFSLPRLSIDVIIPVDDDEYEVESIIRYRQAGSRRGGRMLYTIKWATYKETTEEPEENLGNAILLLY